MDLNPTWEYVADSVMGGVSSGGIRRERHHGCKASILYGDVSLENNGGFIQIACNLGDSANAFDASEWIGLELDISGNGERYDIRLRTDQLTRPWQSFRTEFTALSEWQTYRIPFNTFTSHKTDAKFDQAQLRRIGILAIGRKFKALVAVAGMRLY
ncbi:MAG: CIA30 family protein [Octadecabacter sp.]|nr:CIA30 family protein [Octadecabacter sp.]